MTYEEVKEISSRFESFDECFEDATLDVENMKEEPEFCHYEARINMKTENGVLEIVRIEIDEDSEDGEIYICKNRFHSLTFEQRVEQERAYDICKGIIRDYLSDSIV